MDTGESPKERVQRLAHTASVSVKELDEAIKEMRSIAFWGVVRIRDLMRKSAINSFRLKSSINKLDSGTIDELADMLNEYRGFLAEIGLLDEMTADGSEFDRPDAVRQQIRGLVDGSDVAKLRAEIEGLEEAVEVAAS